MRTLLLALVALVMAMPSVNANEYWVCSVRDGFGYYAPRPVPLYLCCPDDWASYTGVTDVDRNDHLEAILLAADNPATTRPDLAVDDVYVLGLGEWSTCEPADKRRPDGTLTSYLWQRKADGSSLRVGDDPYMTGVESQGEANQLRANPTINLHYRRAALPASAESPLCRLRFGFSIAGEDLLHWYFVTWDQTTGVIEFGENTYNTTLYEDSINIL